VQRLPQTNTTSVVALKPVRLTIHTQGANANTRRVATATVERAMWVPAATKNTPTNPPAPRRGQSRTHLEARPCCQSTTYPAPCRRLETFAPSAPNALPVARAHTHIKPRHLSHPSPLSTHIQTCTHTSAGSEIAPDRPRNVVPTSLPATIEPVWLIVTACTTRQRSYGNGRPLANLLSASGDREQSIGEGKRLSTCLAGLAGRRAARDGMCRGEQGLVMFGLGASTAVTPCCWELVLTSPHWLQVGVLTW